MAKPGSQTPCKGMDLFENSALLPLDQERERRFRPRPGVPGQGDIEAPGLFRQKVETAAITAGIKRCQARVMG
ncbi:MAG: hypothetical protein ACRDJC_04600 [Thermomicrobiales bacterium]